MCAWGCRDGPHPELRRTLPDDLAVGALTSLDPAACARGLARLEPLFDAAWRELGDPRRDFRETLAAAIARLTSVPVPEGDVEVVPDGAVWAYADQDLERRAAAEKLLLRLGPEHARRLQAWLGDLAAARDFYIDTLGFEVTSASYPGALFAAAGGYHHHLGLNTWNSRGAGPRAARLGLGNLAITVPTRDDLDAVTARLRARGLTPADTGRSIEVADPWNTQITLSLPGTSTDELLAR